MRMTTALFGLLLFGVFLNLGGFETGILSDLGVLTPQDWAFRLLILGGTSLGVTVITRLLTGQAPITVPAITFVATLVASPIGVITTSSMPSAVKFLVGGYWSFFLISAIGAALRGDF